MRTTTRVVLTIVIVTTTTVGRTVNARRLMGAQGWSTKSTAKLCISTSTHVWAVPNIHVKKKKFTRAFATRLRLAEESHRQEFQSSGFFLDEALHPWRLYIIGFEVKGCEDARASWVSGNCAAEFLKASGFWRNCPCPGPHGSDLQRGKPVMVCAWMLWLPYALRTRTLLRFGHGCTGYRIHLQSGTRTLLWFGHGCYGYRMLRENERYCLGMDALVIPCSGNTNVIVWAWML